VTSSFSSTRSSFDGGPAGAAKQFQAKPRKSKKKGLDWLGFIRPNRDFSKGYGDSK
jgi:hypothetical protein